MFAAAEFPDLLHHVFGRFVIIQVKGDHEVKHDYDPGDEMDQGRHFNASDEEVREDDRPPEKGEGEVQYP